MNYEEFFELLQYRRSIRKFKPDPFPDEYITKILDAARFAMSGSNAQPWEFIVVKDPKVKQGLFDAYTKIECEGAYYVELMRIPQYRHPQFNVPPEEKEKTFAMLGSWKDAPVCIAVLEDPRKQWGSVLIAHGPTSKHSVLAAGMGHVSMVIQLAAASLGLGSQRVDVISQQIYREVLGFPEPLRLDFIVPLGYRAYEPGPPLRLPLEELVHNNTYDMNKHLQDKEFLKYLERIRNLGKAGYWVALDKDGQ